MMISPKSYVNQFQNASYEELIEQRNALVSYLQEYERVELSADGPNCEWNVHPQPEVRYQVYMDYLIELVNLMKHKYRNEYVLKDLLLLLEEENDE